MNVARTLVIGLVAVFVLQAAEAAKRPTLRPIPEGLVVLTFDDANLSDRTLVAGVLKKHGFGATFYIRSGPATSALSRSQMVKYQKEHFQGGDQ